MTNKKKQEIDESLWDDVNFGFYSGGYDDQDYNQFIVQTSEEKEYYKIEYRILWDSLSENQNNSSVWGLN